MKGIWLTFFLAAASCDWNGTVELEGGREDDSETQQNESDGGDSETNQFDSHSSTNSNADTASDSDSEHAGTDATEPDPDLVLVQVFLPQNAQSGLRDLCGYFTEDLAPPDWESDPHVCNKDSEHTGSVTEPPQRSRWINMPRRDLSGFHFIHVVLYMNEEAVSGTSPTAGVDLTGHTPIPTDLYEGMGIVRSAPIYLGSP